MLARKENETEPLRGVAAARRSVETGGKGLQALSAALSGPLGASFSRSLEIVSQARGRVVVSGMGKSGHVGAKLAATLASTGTPAFFLHPAEASHGDLGMMGSDDVLLALSWSGETAELKDLLFHSRRHRVPLIAMTAGERSTLAGMADVTLLLPRAAEACPHGLAPTTSTLMQLALGDALAIALLDERGFTASDFRALHPGGRLGAALMQVGEIMHRGEALPLVAEGSRMADAVGVISTKGFGCVGVVDAGGRLAGIVTDGDLRRHLGPDLLERPVEAVMTRSPVSTAPETLLAAAIETLNASSINVIFVVEEGRPVGIVHLHDMLRAGVA